MARKSYSRPTTPTKPLVITTPPCSSTPPPKRSISSSSLTNPSPKPPSRPTTPIQTTTSSSVPNSIANQYDAKLFHLVKRIQQDRRINLQHKDTNTSATAKLIVNVLTSNHREYKRKDVSLLHTSVEHCIAELKRQQSEAAAVKEQQQKQQQQRKRKKDDMIAKEEKEDEDAEALRDESMMKIGSGSMLNAGLRNRYRVVQKERDEKKKQIEQDEKEEHQDGKSTPLAPLTEEEDNNMEEEEEKQNNVSSCPPSPSTPSITTTTKKRKSTKKQKLKRSSSKQFSYSSPPPPNENNDPTNPFSDDGVESTDRDLTTPTPRPSERYTDLGGMTNIITQIRQIIEYPLLHSNLFTHLGVDPPRGVLLRGPPGCGKTHLANAIAGELGGGSSSSQEEGRDVQLGPSKRCVTYYRVSSPEIVSGMSGESERRIRNLFTSAANNAPSIVFIDEIDAIAPKRGDGAGGGSGGGGNKGMEKRIVAQLLTSLDLLSPSKKLTRDGMPVIVIGATNRPDSIDSALRRAGRFDREIVLGVPDEECRLGILTSLMKEMRLAKDVNMKVLAKKTPGFVGADVRSLMREAAVVAMNRIFEEVFGNRSKDIVVKQDKSQDGNENDKEEKGESNSNKNDSVLIARRPLTQTELDPLYIQMSDFLQAIPSVQPSSKREGFATVPDVTWSNIGALSTIREELTLSVLEPISHPEKFKELGLPLPAGVMLYGPPGCGKTLLAKAIANESGANFISVKGPELLDKYVGESERAVRVVFDRARSSSPCIVFFDELDSLCPKRGSDSGAGGGGVSERVVNQLLTEMDGLDSRRSVFVIAATNRPELIDPAMLRPGRLDKLLYVPLPTPDDRVAILKALSNKVNLAPDVNLEEIAKSPRSEGYSGADCAALLREAGLAVLRDDALSRRDNLKATGAVVVGDDLGDMNKDEEKETSCENMDIDKNDVSEEEASTQKKTEKKMQIERKHFDYAFQHVMPSVSKKDKARYDRMRDRMARARSRGGDNSEEGGDNNNSSGGGGGDGGGNSNDVSTIASSSSSPAKVTDTESAVSSRKSGPSLSLDGNIDKAMKS